MILTSSYLSEQADKRNINEFSQQRILNENAEYLKVKFSKTYDVFLSHSSLDKKLVLTLLKLFNEAGYTVYIDWIDDKQLDRNNVTKSTAQTLKERMNSSRGLSFLTTKNSTISKWCPWELGYFDGLKNERCCILPVLEYSQSTFTGQEYLGLYPYLTYSTRTDNGKFDFWVYDSSNNGKYVVLSDWLSGFNPLSH